MHLQISREDVLMGRDDEYPLDSTLEDNLHKLLMCVNLFQLEYEIKLPVTSGYRPGKYNQGYSKTSAHQTCEAIDFEDEDGAVKKFILARPEILEECGLYMEDPKRTPTWVHLQTRPTINRIFKV